MTQAAVERNMTRKLVGIAKTALTVELIELLVPGGALVLLALLLTGGSALPILEKAAPFLPFPKAIRRP